MPVEKTSEHRRAQVRMAQRRFRERQNQQKAATAEKDRLPNINANPTYAHVIQTSVPSSSDRPEISSSQPVVAAISAGSADWHNVLQHVPETSPHPIPMSMSSSMSSTTATATADMALGFSCLQHQGNGLLDLQDYISMDGVDVSVPQVGPSFSNQPNNARQESQTRAVEMGSPTQPETPCGTFGILQWRQALNYAISNDMATNSSWPSMHTTESTYTTSNQVSNTIPSLDLEKQRRKAPNQQEDGGEEEEEAEESGNTVSATTMIGNEDAVSGRREIGDGTAGWLYPLHIAARRGHGRIIRILLSSKVDCNQGDSDGLTPLMHAVIGGREDVVTMLLDYGADTCKVDHQGRSVLHWAVIHMRESLLKLLLNHCAGNQKLVDMYNAQGRTPLHTAIAMGYEAGVKILLQAGASTHAKAWKKPDSLQDNARENETPNP